MALHKQEPNKKRPLAGALARWAGHALLDTCFPQGNQCHACGQPMLAGSEAWLCDHCREEMAASALTAQGQPFYLHDWLPESYAAYWHQGPARKLVHRMKYSGDRFAAFPLAEGLAGLWVQQEARALRRAELLIPVPLHPKREKWRGYNQARLLAEGLQAHIRLPMCHEGLARIRHTRRQVGATRQSRQGNMAGAFAVPEASLVRGKCILLLDDVCTTGATAVASARALKEAGAREVLLLTACKA